MTVLYDAILSFINSFLPVTVQTDYAKVNEFFAYVITMIIIFGVIIKPLLKLFKVIK